MTHSIQSSENNEMQWRRLYTLGAVCTLIGLMGILLDVIFGTATGGDLTALPQTAVDRFTELQKNPLLGLYNLDFLNILVQLILIPAYFALYAAHRNSNRAFASLALLIFLCGTVLLVASNAALPMLELSRSYFASGSETEKFMFAAAGEALLARGAHGSLGAFIGFALPNIAGILLAFVMLKGKIFSKTTAYLGIAGSTLLVVYLILVSFVPGANSMATALAMPGGLMAMAWMILFALRLFRLGR
ncbi:MAG: hypothetical protein ACYC1Q_13845 [Bacteroidia bacterium]